jgi:putative ABC transport system permease protein
MWKFLPYIVKNLWRQRTRSVLTVCGAAVAMFVFTFVGSVQEGMAKLGHGDRSERTLIVFQTNRFCPATSRLPEDYARTIAQFPGVEEVVPIQVFTNNCRVSLDSIIFNGLPPNQLQKIRDLHLQAGDWAVFEKQRDAALVGRVLAQRRGLSVGQRFSVGEATVTIAGIFTSQNAAEESFLYTHLEFLQRTRGLNLVGLVTQFEVLLAEGTDPQETGRKIDERFRSGPVQTDTRPKGVFQTRVWWN